MEMKLEVADGVLAELASVGFDPVFGARPLKRAIQSAIENPLAKEILEGHFGPKDVIRVTMSGGRLSFKKG
jgi:ATP-dependent Clp protease ATP-binding subunit ClpB